MVDETIGHTALAASIDGLPLGASRLIVRGTVERGDQRGRLLGFPTANVGLEANSIQPPEGVYAGYAYTDEIVRPAAVSIGRRPTFYESRGLRLLEAHLLDFDGDLYARVITVELIFRLRDQVRFAHVEDLVKQLVDDVERTRWEISRLTGGS